MKSNIVTPVLALGLALTLGACASLTPSQSRADRFTRIHAGLTQDEVRSIAGAAPDITTRSSNGDTLWIYNYEDLWGYDAELDIQFHDGVVTDKFSERTEG
jgi:hypothetical protein